MRRVFQVLFMTLGSSLSLTAVIFDFPSRRFLRTVEISGQPNLQRGSITANGGHFSVVSRNPQQCAVNSLATGERVFCAPGASAAVLTDSHYCYFGPEKNYCSVKRSDWLTRYRGQTNSVTPPGSILFSPGGEAFCGAARRPASQGNSWER
jgi:hypothetical protein